MKDTLHLETDTETIELILVILNEIRWEVVMNLEIFEHYRSRSPVFHSKFKPSLSVLKHHENGRIAEYAFLI